MLARFGELALNSTDLDEILTEACRLVGEALGTDLAKVVELLEDGQTLFVRAGVGWKPGVVSQVKLKLSETSSEGYALKTGEPVISSDIETETRFHYPPFLRENGVRALINVPIIGGRGKPPFGTLQVDSRAPRPFTEADVLFLRGYANLLAASVARLGALLHLEDKNEELEIQLEELHRSSERQSYLSREMEREIAERRHYEAKLEQQAALLDLVQDSIVVRGIDGHISYWNKSAERIYGWTAAEAVGSTVQSLIYTDPEEIESRHAAVVADGSWSGKLNMRHKDGHHLIVEARLTLLRHPDGSPRAILGVNTDITERLEFEQRLRQSQRLEAVGQLTGGIAHDFNNLLTVILGNAEMLAESVELTKSQRTMAEMMLRASERGAALTSQLLAFSRLQALAPKVIDVDQLLAGVGQMARRTLGEHIEIIIVPGTGLGRAFIDPMQLENAVLNLCINARDAMEAGGRLIIETANVNLDENRALAEGDLTPGQYVTISVSDNGSGMTAETLGRAFEPYFTTKEIGHGSGLGLSMVFGFLKQSGGHVKIYSEAGVGTEIRMYIPRDNLAENTSEPLADAPTASVPRGTEWLLLVEDDVTVREHVALQLRQLGYSLVEAADAASALRALKGKQTIDLLFTDVVMPGGINGPQLADAAKLLRPGLRVLFTSGYTAGASGLHGKLEPGAHLLSKPYRRRELAEKVRMALDCAD